MGAPRLVLATANPGKLVELRALLDALRFDVYAAADVGIALPEETGDSYAANATLKAVAVARAAGVHALGDDTGLAIAALGGAPGIHTARYTAELGGVREACDDLAKQTRLRERPEGSVRATLCCALVLAGPSGATTVSSATIEGHLRWPPTDAPGLAAIFAPDPPTVLVEDGVLAHRRRAFAGLVPALTAIPRDR